MRKSELHLIEWIKSHHRHDQKHIVTDIGDDMAVIRIGEEPLLITADMLLDGVHFNWNEGRDRSKSLESNILERVGWKVMGASLSDCAAMAAIPSAAVVSVALPNEMSMEQAQQLFAGMQKAAIEFHCPLVGGDTNSWKHPLAIDLTMLARPGCCPPVLRSGAQKGDIIMVTGELGGSIHGKHLNFTPRIREAQLLAREVSLHAMIDVSDGIAADLQHICRQSGVNALIEADKIPISGIAQKSENPLAAALGDGEDFELLFCVSSEDANEIEQKWPQLDTLPITRIGVITESSDSATVFLKQNGNVKPLDIKGWEHFT